MENLHGHAPLVSQDHPHSYTHTFICCLIHSFALSLLYEPNAHTHMHASGSALSKQNTHHSRIYPPWWKKSHIEEKKKIENGKAASKILPWVLFLLILPVDMCPVRLCVWLLWLGSVWRVTGLRLVPNPLVHYLFKNVWPLHLHPSLLQAWTSITPGPE